MALRIGSLVAYACTAAWGVALIAAFLLNRHHDLVYLPGWLASLARELTARPIIGAAGLFQSLGGVVIATLVVVAWWGLGSAILGFFFVDLPKSCDAVSPAALSSVLDAFEDAAVASMAKSAPCNWPADGAPLDSDEGAAYSPSGTVTPLSGPGEARKERQ